MKTTAPNIIIKAAAIIRRGGIIAFPTETVYGLGCDPFNETAVRRVYEIKKRSLHNPLALLIADVADVWQIAKKAQGNALRLQNELMVKHWPGALTIIIKKKPIIPDIVTGGGDSVGIRLPDHDFCRALIRAVGHPIIGTSANLSGQQEATTAAEVRQIFSSAPGPLAGVSFSPCQGGWGVNGGIDLIVDGGPCSLKIASTVVDVTGEKPKIIRQGSVFI